MICLLNLNIWNKNESFNASNKAIIDVTKTFELQNYKILAVNYRKLKLPFINKGIPFTSKINFYIQLFLIALKINKKDTIYIQYQIDNEVYDAVLQICKLRKCKISFIIHDVYSIRYKNNTKHEVKRLNQADVLLVHTDSMKERLKAEGVTIPMENFNLFDYYTDDECLTIDELLKIKKTIGFAGNLQKSIFLHELINSNIPNNIEYYLYGKHFDLNLSKQEQVKYIGAFYPNKTKFLKAGWGLVWDGNTMDDCTGCLGEYLKINSPHKLSLYLACGIPAIVWKKSSLAQWIEDKHLGISINSLQEIPTIIDSISDSEYKNICKQVRLTSKKLRNGIFLSSIINKH